MWTCMLRARGGCQKGWCVMQTIFLLILLQLWRTPAEEQAVEQAVQRIYWVYVPDPPLLHPVSWKSPEGVCLEVEFLRCKIRSH
ncbi:Zinc finger MYND domain-containing protein 19 [Manis javanica]|nr:Zinc finger MYND domain-containing protein 19 [Manis javanica]